MILYLTSSPFIDGADRAILSPANGLLARLKADLPENPSCLFICSSPDRRDLTARFGADIFSAFAEAGFPFCFYAILDGYNADCAAENCFALPDCAVESCRPWKLSVIPMRFRLSWYTCPR